MIIPGEKDVHSLKRGFLIYPQGLYIRIPESNILLAYRVKIIKRIIVIGGNNMKPLVNINVS